MFWIKAIFIIIPYIKWDAFAELNDFLHVNFSLDNECVGQIELWCLAFKSF